MKRLSLDDAKSVSEIMQQFLKHTPMAIDEINSYFEK